MRFLKNAKSFFFFFFFLLLLREERNLFLDTSMITRLLLLGFLCSVLIGRCEKTEHTRFLETRPIHLVVVGNILNQTKRWCVVESLLRTATQGAKMEIVIWYNRGPKDLKPDLPGPIMKQIAHFHEKGVIRFAYLDFDLILADTPLTKLFTPQVLSNIDNEEVMEKALGPLWKINLCDSSRLAILWKEGGVYIDLDHIVLQDIRELTPGMPSQAPKDFPNNALLAFPPAHPFIEMAMKRFTKGYDGVMWGKQGPLLMRYLWRYCKKTDDRCGGLILFPFDYNYKTFNGAFFPEKNNLQKRDKVLQSLNNTIALHTWNHVSGRKEDANLLNHQKEKNPVGSFAENALGYMRLKYCPCVAFEMLLTRPVSLEGVIEGGDEIDVHVCRKGFSGGTPVLETRELRNLVN